MKMSPLVRASFELLGVAPSATAPELKKAFHSLALLYHPDRNPSENAAAEFQKVREAFELLNDQARVRELNLKHHRERLLRPVIEGIEITFGSFFGYRFFDPDQGASEKMLINGKAGPAPRSNSQSWIGPVEENNSVLDHAAFDAIEVVYAGRHSLNDEEQLMNETKTKDLAKLPWVVLNNHGILRFLEGDLRGSKKAYLELCKRIPNNILFTYRLGLCEILEGFKNPKRTLLGRLQPDRILIERGVQLLQHCLKLGEERKVGRQKCLVIRKTLADVFEKTGRAREARKLWKEIFKEDPRCAEAVLRVKGSAEARAVAALKAGARDAGSARLRLGRGGRER